jgi:hypothetical protein
MTAYGMYGSAVLQTVTGIEVDGKVISVDRIRALMDAVTPLVAIADAYDASGLDEVRPEWRIANPGAVELYSGRGGKRLLTLADCLKAREALK